jgi:hypothetical protein
MLHLSGQGSPRPPKMTVTSVLGFNRTVWYNTFMRLFNFTHRDKRYFFRHPLHMPIQLRLAPAQNDAAAETRDISLGGLKFLWPYKLLAGTQVDIDIPVRSKHFQVKARIAYSREDKRAPGFQTGATFTDFSSAFRAKLAEEILDIIEYRKKIVTETGVDVSEEEAAQLWVKQEAEKFPILTEPESHS